MDGTVTVELYSDEMAAVVFIMPPEGSGRPVVAAEVKSALEKADVVHGLVDAGIVTEAVEKGKTTPVDFLVTSTEPGRGADAEVAFLWEEMAPAGDEDGETGRPDVFRTVSKGEVIARKKPATKGGEGMTVTGKKVAGEDGKDVELRAGANVTASEDGLEFTAALDGIPRAAGGVVSVEPVYVVAGDVDGSTGNVVFAGGLEIRGSVREGYLVKADGSVIVRQDVFGAEVTAGGDVLVTGSIITSHGLITAGGSVSAEMIKNSIVEAGGDVVTGTGIINSTVRANGSVICISEKGRIAGGEVLAFGEIRAKELGVDSGAGTILRSGFKFKTFKKLAEMENLREKVDSEIANIKKSIMSPRVGQDEIINLKKFLDKLYQASGKINNNIGALYDRLKVNPLASVKGEDAINAGCVVYIGFAKRKIVRAMRKANLYADGEGGMNVAHYDPKSDTMKSFNVRPKK